MSPWNFVEKSSELKKLTLLANRASRSGGELAFFFS